MKVANFPTLLPKGKKTLVLGAFNSFHNGHKKLIDRAKLNKEPVVVMIIEGISILPSKGEEYTSLDIRLQQFANYGVDFVTIINFKEVALMSGQDFLEKLTEVTGATSFVGGKDFAMGKGRDLKIKDIPNAVIVEPEKVADKKISTTILKELVEVGDVKLIRSLAPFYYQMKVHVDSENKVSKITQIIPHPGVYAAYIIFNDVKYPGIVHINMNKELTVKVPDFQVKNVNYDPVISFVKMTRKIYKTTHDVIAKADEEEVWASLSNSNTYL